jgi:putative heme degradation protein
MVKITCDVCDKVRPDSDKRLKDDSWILGYDIEVETASALQRSLRFLDRWDNTRVLELGAIHLCSDKCKEEYIREARAAA